MKKGFTLLELLIGIAVFAVIAASVYTSLYLGIKVWKQEDNNDQVMAAAVLTLDIIAQELRCAFINPKNETIKFIGAAEQVDFFSVNKEGDVENVVFYLDPGLDSGLSCLMQSKRNCRSNDTEEPDTAKVVNSAVRSFKLSYFDSKNKKWFENWPEELVLPQEVKIEVSFFDKVNKENKLDLAKYVYIPAASIIPKFATGHGEEY